MSDITPDDIEELQDAFGWSDADMVSMGIDMSFGEIWTVEALQKDLGIVNPISEFYDRFFEDIQAASDCLKAKNDSQKYKHG